MSNQIIEFLSKTEQIPAEEIEILSSLAKPVLLKKGDYLYEEGKIPKRGAFVLSGILREYYTDVKNTDYIRRFYFSNWWIVDMYELTYEKPALCSVQAIQDAQVLTFTKEDCDMMIKKCPVATKVLHEISSAEKYSLGKKEKEKRSLTAIENYKNLLNNNPELDKRIPLFHIAAYLNIQPESLSRIRKQMNEN